MGQKVCKCVKTESADDHRSDVYTVPENPPEKPSADARDHSPPPAGATDGEVSANRDGGKKKKRFWRKLWRKCRKSGRCEREELTTNQNPPEPSTADTRHHSPPPAADVHEEEVDENKDKEKKKRKNKKMRFWKKWWRKTPQIERKVQTDRSTEGK